MRFYVAARLPARSLRRLPARSLRRPTCVWLCHMLPTYLKRSCGDAPPWRVRPGRRAVGRNSRSPQVGPGTPC